MSFSNAGSFSFIERNRLTQHFLNEIPAQFVCGQYFRFSPCPQWRKLVSPCVVLPIRNVLRIKLYKNIDVAGILTALAKIIAQNGAKYGKPEQMMPFKKVTKRRFNSGIIKPQTRAQTWIEKRQCRHSRCLHLSSGLERGCCRRWRRLLVYRPLDCFRPFDNESSN